MDIQEMIQKKKEYLQELVNGFQVTQKRLEQISNTIHETNGALEVLEQLQKDNSKDDSKDDSSTSESKASSESESDDEVKDTESNEEE